MGAKANNHLRCEGCNGTLKHVSWVNRPYPAHVYECKECGGLSTVLIEKPQYKTIDSSDIEACHEYALEEDARMTDAKALAAYMAAE